MNNNKANLWVPLADLMTVLMVLFLFLAISYMYVLQKKQEKQNELIIVYGSTKDALHKDLDRTFGNEFKKWNVTLDEDLSLKFINPQVLFPVGSAELTPYFQEILSEFIPRYFSIVLSDKYRNRIAEVRIEGHTDTRPISSAGDPYMENMKLSQDRARNVLDFIRKQPYVQQLPPTDRAQLQFWLTANGLSYGRSVNSSGEFSFYNNGEVDESKSRRVEFRILTTSEEILEQAIKNLQ